MPAPPWFAWDAATDTEQKRIYYDMISVRRTDAEGGRAGDGSQYHCVHKLGEVTFTITDWEAPSPFSSNEVVLGVPIEFTMQFLLKGDGTRIRILDQDPDEGDKDELEPLFRAAAQDALQRLAEILEQYRFLKRLIEICSVFRLSLDA